VETLAEIVSVGAADGAIATEDTIVDEKAKVEEARAATSTSKRFEMRILPSVVSARYDNS
jgi:hypothetical protein